MDEWVEGGRSSPTTITPRELEVVKLIAEAYTNRQIAETLKVSEKTVESHRANVLSKLEMRDRVELVLRDSAGLVSRSPAPSASRARRCTGGGSLLPRLAAADSFK